MQNVTTFVGDKADDPVRFGARQASVGFEAWECQFHEAVAFMPLDVCGPPAFRCDVDSPKPVAFRFVQSVIEQFARGVRRRGANL
jgi:hypothetical protein